MYCTVEDVNILFRPLSPQEKDRTTALIPIVEDTLRQEAKKVSKDLDRMIEKGELLPNVLKSVIVDIVGRFLVTSTDSEPLTQFSESALGYSVSGTYFNAGGGLFIKRNELARLGLRRQRYGAIELD